MRQPKEVGSVARLCASYVECPYTTGVMPN